MKKNGTYFLSTVDRRAFQSSVWDPYAYREKMQNDMLEHFASVRKVRGASSSTAAFK